MLRRLLLVSAALVAAWVVACLVLFVWPPAESSAPGHADVVVVLSGDKKRLAPGLALIRRGVAPVLAISTVGRTPHWPQAVALCRRGRYAQARVLCFDAIPFSTQGEARTVARLAREHIGAPSSSSRRPSTSRARRCSSAAATEGGSTSSARRRPGGSCRRSGSSRAASCSCSSRPGAPADEQVTLAERLGQRHGLLRG